jgi:hypothetical protein
MLIITRKKSEKIMIGDDIELVVVDTGRSRVRLGVNAPRSISVHSVKAPAAAVPNPPVPGADADGSEAPVSVTAPAGIRRA